MKYNVRNKLYYSKLKVNRRLRFVLFVTIMFAFVCLLLYLNFNFSMKFNSLVIIIPSILISSIVLFIPPSEEWEYCAWNSKIYSLEEHVTVILDDSVNF